MKGKKGLFAFIAGFVGVIVLSSVAYAALSPKASIDEATLAASNAQSSSQASSTQSAQTDSQLQPMSEFTVEDMQGNKVTLSSMKGKPTLLGFWATWCPPCNAEAPEIQKLYERYGSKINFMMVDATDGQRDTRETVEAWYAEKGYSYPVYLDTNFEASMAGQVQYLPTTYLLDAEGNILYASTGSLDESSGARLLDQILGENAA